jgi:tetratricopeptide (TPR) repeat protein
MRCLDKNPEGRWPDFATLRARLRFILERQYNTPYRPRTLPDPSPREVAVQVRALTVLEGYERAVRRRRLREGHAQSPYAFHLALASYFRVEGERDEERAQLERAARIRGDERGYEVVRRLAQLMLEDECLDDAERILREFLSEHPDSLHLVLEPQVALLLRRGRFADAQAILARFPRTLRLDGLYADLYAAAGRQEELAALLNDRATSLLAGLVADVERVQPEDRPGWSRAEDPQALAAFLAEAAPETDTQALLSTRGVLWPDLSGDPDFTDAMAWLSEVYGRLGSLHTVQSHQERARAERLGRVLGYPARLRDHLRRDEEWLWRAAPEE